jgi:hypothetical protein
MPVKRWVSGCVVTRRYSSLTHYSRRKRPPTITFIMNFIAAQAGGLFFTSAGDAIDSLAR